MKWLECLLSLKWLSVFIFAQHAWWIASDNRYLIGLKCPDSDSSAFLSLVWFWFCSSFLAECWGWHGHISLSQCCNCIIAAGIDFSLRCWYQHSLLILSQTMCHVIHLFTFLNSQYFYHYILYLCSLHVCTSPKKMSYALLMPLIITYIQFYFVEMTVHATSFLSHFSKCAQMKAIMNYLCSCSLPLCISCIPNPLLVIMFLNNKLRWLCFTVQAMVLLCPFRFVCEHSQGMHDVWSSLRRHRLELMGFWYNNLGRCFFLVLVNFVCSSYWCTLKWVHVF